MINMVVKKSAALNVRIDPNIKEAVRIAAKRERRSIANMVEVLILNYCEENGICIPDQQELFNEESSTNG